MTKARDIASANPAPTTVSTTELGYVDGVTSAIQTQIDAKLATTLADAKGDIFAATADNTVTRLAVGSNGDTIVADTSTATGLRYNPQNALANPVINGGMDIWARGTSISTGGTFPYTADRWKSGRGAFAAGTTISRQSVGDSTNLPNIQYCLRWQRDSGNTSNLDMRLGMNIETAQSIPFAGKVVTLSFYARKSSTWSSPSGTLSISLVSGTGTDQGGLPEGGYTNQATVCGGTIGLSTTWTRYAFTGTMSSIATQLGIISGWDPSGTAGANDWVEITGVQVDLGTYTASTAPSFRRSGGTIQGELAACQRYFIAYSGDASVGSMGAASTTSVNRMVIPTPVTMRTTPSASFTGTITLFDGVAVTNVSSLGTTWMTQNAVGQNFNVASGLTQFRPYQCYLNNGSLLFSAEL